MTAPTVPTAVRMSVHDGSPATGTRVTTEPRTRHALCLSAAAHRLMPPRKRLSSADDAVRGLVAGHTGTLSDAAAPRACSDPGGHRYWSWGSSGVVIAYLAWLNRASRSQGPAGERSAPVYAQ